MLTRNAVAALGLVIALALAAFVPTRRAVAKSMDMAHMIEMAKTPADHDKLAAQYEQDAKAARATAAMHQKMAEAYRKEGGAIVSKSHFDEHCDALAKSYTSAAEEYDALAKAEREMAKGMK